MPAQLGLLMGGAIRKPHGVDLRRGAEQKEHPMKTTKVTSSQLPRIIRSAKVRNLPHKERVRYAGAIRDGLCEYRPTLRELAIIFRCCEGSIRRAAGS